MKTRRTTTATRPDQTKKTNGPHSNGARGHKSVLERIGERAVDLGLPRDLSAQVDHYLYGGPKKD